MLSRQKGKSDGPLSFFGAYGHCIELRSMYMYVCKREI